MKNYSDLSAQNKQIRRLWLLLIVATCGVIIGSQLKRLLIFLEFVT